MRHARPTRSRSPVVLILSRADAKRARAVGGTVGVDATFGPPPLQDPFKWGADVVMREFWLTLEVSLQIGMLTSDPSALTDSGTKYFAGHSDALCGTVSVRDKADWLKL